MQKTIELICENCKNKFTRRLTEHNRNISKKRRVFCSLKCHGKIVHEHLIPYWEKNKQYLLENSHNQPDEFTLFRVFLQRIRTNNSSIKTKRKPNVDIDLQFLKNLWVNQKGLCSITKIPMSLKKSSNRGNTSPYQTSLDRIDNNLPYSRDNVRLVCLIYNYMRNGFTDEQCVKFIEDFYANKNNS